MPEPTHAQATLTRLLDAERQALEIVTAAEQRAQDTIARAHDEAARLIDTVRRETERSSEIRLEECQSRAAVELKQRLDAAEAEGGALERRANEHLSEAVEIVVCWVTGQAPRES